jgi:hypothetical protein
MGDVVFTALEGKKKVRAFGGSDHDDSTVRVLEGRHRHCLLKPGRDIFGEEKIALAQDCMGRARLWILL